MPTEIHDCHQGWLNLQMKEWFMNGHLTNDEFRRLDPRVGTSKLSDS